MKKYRGRRIKCNDLDEENELGSFGLAEMEFPLDKKVQEAITNYMKESVMGYSQAPDSYYETVGNWMRRDYNAKIKNEDIVITSGVIPAIKTFIELRTQPEKKVVILTPSYNNFYTAIEDTGRIVEEVEMDYDAGHYSIDFDQLEQSLSDDAAEMLIICNPHNPIGRLLTKDELGTMIDLCEKHDVFVVSDEIHGDLIFDEAEFNSALDFDLKIPVCTSGSKTFNIAGFKISNILITDEKLRAEFIEYINKHNLAGNNAIGLFGTEKSYELSEEWLADKLAIIQENVKLVRETLADTKVIVSEQNATYLMWLNFDFYLKKEPKLFEQLAENGICFSEGTLYGEAGKGFARVNVATGTDCVEKMLARLVKILDEIKSA